MSLIIVTIDAQDWHAFHNAQDWGNYFEPVFRKILTTLNRNQNFEISVLLTSDTYVQQLNHQYRGKNKSTNVLSFPQLTDEINLTDDENILLGDIAMSYQTILQESKDQQKPFLHHVTHLFIHSCLHLFGFDHQTDNQAHIMENLEIDILSKFNINNPYLF